MEIAAETVLAGQGLWAAWWTWQLCALSSFLAWQRSRRAKRGEEEEGGEEDALLGEEGGEQAALSGEVTAQGVGARGGFYESWAVARA